MDKFANESPDYAFVDDYILVAIEYGMEIAEQKERDNRMFEKDSLRAYHEQVRNPYLRNFFKELRRRASING